MGKEKGIGKPTPEMKKYLTPDANAFLKSVYKAIGANTLQLRVDSTNSKPVDSVEKIFYSLNYLVPNADDVVSALELMATLPKNSIHERITFSDIIKYPESMLKLAKNRNEVYSLIKELDARKCQKDCWQENQIFEKIDELIKLANEPYKTKVIEVLDELKRRDIKAFARYSEDEGFLENPNLIDNIYQKKEAFFKGLDTLTKIGYTEYQNKQYATVWETISKGYRNLIAIGKDENLQALLIGLKRQSLFSETNLIDYYSFNKLKPLAKYQKELLKFIKRYNKILGKHHKEYFKNHGLHFSALVEISEDSEQVNRFIKVFKNKDKSLARVRKWCNPKTRKTDKNLREYLINFGQKERFPAFD
jgi:hypothetical protein